MGDSQLPFWPVAHEVRLHTSYIAIHERLRIVEPPDVYSVRLFTVRELAAIDRSGPEQLRNFIVYRRFEQQIKLVELLMLRRVNFSHVVEQITQWMWLRDDEQVVQHPHYDTSGPMPIIDPTTLRLRA